ncbi:MAG: hypothetical protein DCC67_05775 [Planctomycetota bacterium]|nr:MAG: hypothetical protein DCC67_05775 [Planctomycetota bacterium]
MTPLPLTLEPLLAQASVPAAAPGSPRIGTPLVSYRFGRLEQFDDPRLLWAGVAVAALLLALFVAWQYRRESSALPRWTSVVLAGLRLTAFAGAIVFFLSPLKRTDQQVVTESRVAVLVDASQSMAVEDETLDDETGLARSDAVLRALRDKPLIDRLRQQHDVTVVAFGSDIKRIAHWKRRGAPQADRESARGDDEAPGPDLAEALRPIGPETRLGDALAAMLADRAGGPLAGIFALSDGGQNLGVEPLAVADEALAAKVPIVTVGLGSTAPRRNVRIQELIAPARVYPDDKAVIRALVQSEGYAGRTFTVEFFAREATSESGATDAAQAGGVGDRLGQVEVAVAADGQTALAELSIEPAKIGRLELRARVAAPADDQYAEDNERAAEVEVVEDNTRVLLVASGATRDYRFLRDQLRRDPHADVDVWLQLSPPGISQDADRIRPSFPSSKEDLYQYDCIVAFDPNWTQLDAAQADLLEKWVAEDAGGMIVVAGPVHTSAWVQSPEHAKIRALYPVEFQRRLTLLDDGLYGSKTAWPIEFTREGLEADFLWLGDTPEENRARWKEFPGVFGAYAVKGAKPGAQVYARYSDPEAGLSAERPVYFADHFYGAGRVFYMGSGELWRLRNLDPGYFERLYTQLVRHVSQGRLLRGASTGRLLVERDRYFIGDTAVIRAQLNTASREPYVAPHVMARLTPPSRGDDEGGRPAVTNVKLTADATRPGNFVGQFIVASQGTYRIELQAPDAPEELLVKRISATVPDLEFADTRRNETLLKALAARSGGRYYPSLREAVEPADGATPAAELITSRAETRILRGKPDDRFSETLNRSLLGVICGALGLEWLLRRLMKLA